MADSLLAEVYSPGFSTLVLCTAFEESDWRDKAGKTGQLDVFNPSVRDNDQKEKDAWEQKRRERLTLHPRTPIESIRPTNPK